MDAEILKTFLDEAESYLPTMRQGIIAYELDASRLADLQTSRRLAHTVKGSAKTLNLAEIGETALEIESELKIVIQSKSALSEDKANELLSKILVLEADLKEMRNSWNGKQQFSGAAEDTGEVFQIPDSVEEMSLESVIEEFEIDSEMLEVFSLEAEDLLRNINLNLETLSKTPNNREALLEIRRNAHTLKGSAGIVGFKSLSALAHRVEDLLDYLSENEIESTERVFELLLKSSDCISALAGGDNSPRLKEKIEGLYQSFDSIFASLQSEESPAQNTSENLSRALDPATAKQAEISAAASSIIQPTKNEVVESENAKSESRKNPSGEPIKANRPVIRVSVERLNDLYNLVGEMVISRSVFEQRLRELEQQIEELHHTTSRLRTSTGKLETDLHTNSPETSNSVFRAAKPLSQSSSLFQSSAANFDSLEFDRYDESHQTALELIEAASDASAINTSLDHLLDNLNLLFDSQRRLIEDMQLNVLRLRMISLGSLSSRLQRTVRVTADEEGKQAELVIENESLEIETEILDSFVESLLHLLRNAVAHGIETPEIRRQKGKPEKGRITLRAFSEGTHIVFVIDDDGNGISASALKGKAVQAGFMSKKEADTISDEEAYSLVFLPGLSTTPEVNQVSGRGVGMNIVGANITRRQGTISVKSEVGKGTSFTIRLPMSLTATRAVLVKAGMQTYAFPLNLVQQITEISTEEFEKASAEKSLTYDKTEYSLIHFSELLDLSGKPVAEKSKMPLILLNTLDNPCALAVDQILKTEEIVIKSLDSILKNIPEITGASVLGDGSVIPVLDLVYLLKKETEKGKKSVGITQNLKSNNLLSGSLPISHSPILKVMVVDDSPSVRQFNSRLIKNAGWQVSAAKDGLEALEKLQTSGDLPDIILTDVEMPRMNGYELLASLKRQPSWQKIPVIMITSRAGSKHRQKALDLGAGDYLVKPYENAELLEKIRILTSREKI